MEGYYTKNLDGNEKGRLKIEVSNLPEFNELLKQAESEARQLNETVTRLRNFQLAIDFSIAASEEKTRSAEGAADKEVTTYANIKTFCN